MALQWCGGPFLGQFYQSGIPAALATSEIGRHPVLGIDSAWHLGPALQARRPFPSGARPCFKRKNQSMSELVKEAEQSGATHGAPFDGMECLATMEDITAEVIVAPCMTRRQLTRRAIFVCAPIMSRMVTTPSIKLIQVVTGIRHYTVRTW